MVDRSMQHQHLRQYFDRITFIGFEYLGPQGSLVCILSKVKSLIWLTFEHTWGELAYSCHIIMFILNQDLQLWYSIFLFVNNCLQTLILIGNRRLLWILNNRSHKLILILPCQKVFKGNRFPQKFLECWTQFAKAFSLEMRVPHCPHTELWILSQCSLGKV